MNPKEQEKRDLKMTAPKNHKLMYTKISVKSKSKIKFSEKLCSKLTKKEAIKPILVQLYPIKLIER